MVDTIPPELSLPSDTVAVQGSERMAVCPTPPPVPQGSLTLAPTPQPAEPCVAHPIAFDEVDNFISTDDGSGPMVQGSQVRVFLLFFYVLFSFYFVLLLR